MNELPVNCTRQIDDKITYPKPKPSGRFVTLIDPQAGQLIKSKDGHCYVRVKGALRRVTIKEGADSRKTVKKVLRDVTATKLAYSLGLIKE